MRRQVQTCHRQPARAQIEKLSMPQQETGTRPVEHAKNEGTVTDTRVDNQDNLSDAPSGGHLCVDNISWTSSGTTSDERTTPDFVDALTDQETSQAFVGPRLHASFIGANGEF
ncbi:hypothetical protein BaRGS_00016570 [Batillaria attramentaria]|uniref:Uncharacterized protein n=1 Tax=Batillaria attramentaria TaxID=370345 RepID=A0ABD0KZD2_9CAEN